MASNTRESRVFFMAREEGEEETKRRRGMLLLASGESYAEARNARSQGEDVGWGARVSAGALGQVDSEKAGEGI